MPKIVVVGSINMDLVVRAPRFALAGETILGHAFATIPGGKGANQAVAARRLGAEVAIIGRVGSDAFGATMRQNMAREGIDTGSLITGESQSSGVALITVDDNGENTIVVVPGANGQLSTSDIEAARVAIVGADILLMQLEIPLEVVLYAAQTAVEAGVAVILNAAPARPLPANLLSQVDFLVVNETEAYLLTGGSSHIDLAAQMLRAIGSRNVVVTLGEGGSMLVTETAATLSVPAFDVHVVDTTAAGDAFVGAFAVALAAGMPAHDALRWGNAAGALAVTRVGAQPSLPDRAELEAFLRVHDE